MRGVETERLEGGVCLDMAPEVVDKYLHADRLREPFQYRVGRLICAGCPVEAACLEDAIVEPPGAGIRGGEPASALWRLHARWMDEHVAADVLARQALSRQTGLRGLRVVARNTMGRFQDVPLAFPEMGGAA